MATNWNRDPDRARAQADLRLIRETVARNRRLVAGTWRHQVWWGGLTAAGLVGTWWAQSIQAWRAILILWVGLIGAGWLGSYLLGRDSARRSGVNNPATRAFTGIWIGAGGSLTLLGVVGIQGGGIAPGAFPGVLAALLGSAYLSSARAADLPWLSWFAWAWWVSSLALLLAPGPWAYLALAGLLVALEVVPGLLLSREEQRRTPSDTGPTDLLLGGSEP